MATRDAASASDGCGQLFQPKEDLHTQPASAICYCMYSMCRLSKSRRSICIMHSRYRFNSHHSIVKGAFYYTIFTSSSGFQPWDIIGFSIRIYSVVVADLTGLRGPTSKWGGDGRRQEWERRRRDGT